MSVLASVAFVVDAVEPVFVRLYTHTLLLLTIYIYIKSISARK